MVEIDFKDDGRGVYVLMLADNNSAVGAGLMSAHAIQFFPSIKACYAQIARDAHNTGQRVDDKVYMYRIYFFDTGFTVAFDAGVMGYNVIEVDRAKWTGDYLRWCDRYSAKRS